MTVRSLLSFEQLLKTNVRQRDVYCHEPVPSHDVRPVHRFAAPSYVALTCADIPEMGMGWVDPRVGLNWVGSLFADFFLTILTVFLALTNLFPD
jgi:hypothetical protein